MLSLTGRLCVDLVASEFRADDDNFGDNIISLENSLYFKLEKEYGNNKKCKDVLDSILLIRKEIEDDASIESKNCGKQISWVKYSNKLIKEASLSEGEYEYVNIVSKYIFREHTLATMGLIGLLGL